MNEMFFEETSNQSLSTLLENRRFEDALKVADAAVNSVLDTTDELIKKIDKKVLKAVEMV